MPSHPAPLFWKITCNFSAFSRKMSDCAVISTNGRNLERWHITKVLKFLVALGMTRDAE